MTHNKAPPADVDTHDADESHRRDSLPGVPQWQWLNHGRGGLVTAAVLGILLVALATGSAAAGSQSGGPPVDCQAADGPRVTAEDALTAKQTAQNRQTELTSLAETPQVQVPGSVRESVTHHIERGDLLIQTEQYCQALEHYETAIDQATAALIRGYTERGQLLLTAADTHLQKLDQRGYVTLETTRLDEQIATQRDRLQQVETLQEARRTHDRAEQLSTAVDNKPDPAVVDRARFIGSWYAIPVALVSLLLAGGLGAAVQRVRSPPARSVIEGSDPEEEEEDIW